MPTASPPPNSPRIAPLAVLPVFLDLCGKRTVVIGGSQAAVWKIELLAAARARVEVFAEEVCGDLHALLAPSPVSTSGSDAAAAFFSPSGRRWRAAPDEGEVPPSGITLHPRPWTPSDLDGAALAVADLADDAEARAFAAAARAASVPYNVIDHPEFCQFQFGAIVNRSPVVVGISTAGAAPILGQAVRRRIETLLPQTLAQWAQLAARVRDRVMESLAPGPQRRAFWERLAENAFGPRPPTPADADPGFAALPPTGRATLVGTGSAEADLLTIRAVRALQSADVILFDESVSAEVLELARREARRLPVSRRDRDDADARMLALARQGKHVVRLGANPSSHAGVAAAMMEREGIPVSIVPGISPELGGSFPPLPVEGRGWGTAGIRLTSSRTSAPDRSRSARSSRWWP